MRYIRLPIFLTVLGMFQIASSQDITSASADEIGRTWKSNAVGANMKFGNKSLNITGVVDKVDSTSGRYFVVLKADSLLLGIYVYLDSRAPLDAIANLRAGQRVTMYCEKMIDNFGIECYEGRLIQ